MSRTTCCIPAAVILAVLFFTTGCMTVPAGPAQLQSPAVPAYPVVSVLNTPVQYATVNGAILAYREFGNGEPLLIIVGFGATMDQINDTAVSILASRYHVYLYNHRGMERSSGGSANPSIGGYAEEAEGLITALGHTSMHIY